MIAAISDNVNETQIIFLKMEIHIGHKIKEVAKKNRFRIAELARAIGKSRPNVNSIFTRETIDIELLYKISKALSFDFFALYSDKLKFETGLDHSMTKDVESMDRINEERIQHAQNQQKLIALLEEKIATLQEKRKD